MKYKVIKEYADRITKEYRAVGDVVELTDERADELKAGGYVEDVKKGAKKK
jgi:hypothetical protein